MTLNPIVIDISHHNKVQSFEAAYQAGIRGVIHKATEGLAYVDKDYGPRRQAAHNAKMLWGAYHFLRPGNMAQQVKHFVQTAQPDSATLMALDHEDDRVGANSAREFLDRLDQAVGRRCALYSGHLIKDQLGHNADPFFGSHRLWLAQYSNRAVVQKSWQTYWLWQYTGDGKGQEPHNIPGISIPGNKGIDINTFQGTAEELAAQWAGEPLSASPNPPLPPYAPPVLRKGSSGPTVLKLQQLLNTKSIQLTADGVFGAQTEAAVRRFQQRNGLVSDGVVGAATWTALEGDSHA